MVKFLLLSILFIASPAFALCMDCDMRIPQKTLFDTDWIRHTMYSVMIVWHILLIYLCFMSWNEKQTIMSKIVKSLLVVVWTGLFYSIYVNIHSYIFYTALTMAISYCIHLYFGGFKSKEIYGSKSVKKSSILIVLYLITVVTLHVFGPDYANELGIVLYDQETMSYGF
jgi:hypothetical protein